MIDIDKERQAFVAWHVEFCSRRPRLDALPGMCADDKKAWAAWQARASQVDDDVRRDAQRYRWLRANAPDAHMWSDESIDYAMAEGEEVGRG